MAFSDKIAIIYDSKSIKETISLLGRDKWNNLVEIDNPKDAIGILQQEKPSLALLCAMTGQTKAYALCQQLKKTEGCEDIYVAILTFKISDEIRKKAEDVGADGTIHLAGSTDDLVLKLKTILQAKSLTAPQQKKSAPVSHSKLNLEERLEDVERKLDNLEKIVHKIAEKLKI
jgi:response regulator RpfG family c-di-GMP phosphodiesterase